MKKLLFVLASLALVACKEAKKEELVESTSNSEVTKSEEKAPDDTATPKAEAPVALSTKSLAGEVISVTKAKVIGKILYVEVILNRGGKSGLHVIDIKEINYVDDAEAKKHEVLKDDEGVYQASPLQTSGSSKLQVSTSSSKSEALISLKFAAPPETSKTITLNMPDFGSFDSIPITR
ncbi:hypothetical protein [Soonwooa sp.]|uniref:hypothetical protein n=1 Tax=Soonwooa sp. TaxID=1938592 RepID=UPI0028966AE4|nr:hypothetical protein [Soonwooa sp.]